MATVLRPHSSEEIQSIVRDAVEEKHPIEIIGSGSHRRIGNAVTADITVEMNSYAGVELYEPDELVLTVKAGTLLSDIEQLLRENHQQLAFEPPNFCPLWGESGGSRTIGGAMSLGFGGSRRITAGAPRDHFLGLKAVSGFGQEYAAGGRVVKNVTGYDLPKLLAGAFGTLGVLTQITLKVLPAAEKETTVCVTDLGPDGTILLRKALDAGLISSAAHIPATCVPLFNRTLGAVEGSVTCFRLEGFEEEVEANSSELKRLFTRRQSDTFALESPASGLLWAMIGGGHPLTDQAAAVWRIAPPPAAAARILASLSGAGIVKAYVDCAGGVIWAELPVEMGQGEVQLREAIGSVTGEAKSTLMRPATEAPVAQVPFEPLSTGLMALHRKVKQQFDPQGVLNPSRTYRGL